MLALACAALAADDTVRHYHRGKLPKYSLSPPSIMLSDGDEEQLSQGRALTQVVVTPNLKRKEDDRRLIMVRDVQTPSWVVMDRLLDFDAYPRMIKACELLEPYADEQHGGVRTMKATYEIKVAHMKLRYHMQHDIKDQCMTFHLDYDRRSDLDDSVGYWFVQPTGVSTCRVFYSCDTKLRGWVPGPVYGLLDKAALKQATSWVSDEATKEWRKLSRQGGAGRMVAGLRSRVQRLPSLPKLPDLKRPLLQSTSSKLTSFRSALGGRRTALPASVTPAVV